MPRFYFNYRNLNQSTQEVVLVKDDEGIELPGLEAARATALASAREVVAENVKSATAHVMEVLFVTDENGRELLTIPAREVLPETLR
jgi:hypothetical protein